MKNTTTFNAKSIKGLFLLCAVTLMLPFTTLSNNIRITNVVNTNPGDANPILTFDVAWDNSWKVSSGPSNYDAAWIFVKYQTVAVDAPNCESFVKWEHAKMKNLSPNFSTDSPLEHKFVDDSVGIFVYRTADGVGNIPTTSVSVQLELPVPIAPNAPEYNFKVFGIEMVYIPQGGFELGDSYSTNSFNSIYINNSTTTLTAAQIGGNVRNTIPSEFPKGYNAFYSMKYEITQQQYVDFLNTLDFTQQVARTNLSASQLVTPPGNGGICAMQASCLNRNSVKLIKEGMNPERPAEFVNDLQTAPGDPFNSPNDGQTIAMNYLSVADLYAYLDWSGLRPMTNFEFEKMSRGPLSRQANEYPWGSTNITQAMSSSLNNEGTSSEVSTASGAGLAAYGAVATDGPLRVGFSATGSTNRETSGASFYGAMNLGGNVFEVVLGGYNEGQIGSTGVGYKLRYENLGDGTLASSGNSNTPNWQIYTMTTYSSCYNGNSNRGVSNIELRGGSYSSSSTQLRTSDRSNIKNCQSGSHVDSRTATVGGRGVR